MNTENQIIKSLITPNAQTINKIFQQAERYYIDIYQRDYKWEKVQVVTLLKDIELWFNFSPIKENIEVKEVVKDVTNRFRPYFLNTFLTCKMSSHVAIVDGQQRLTTILIILIKLRQLVAEVESDDKYSQKSISSKKLDKLIYEADDFDSPEYYKIYNPNRQEVFNVIFRNDESLVSFEGIDETQRRIKENYLTISEYYNSFFKDSVQKINVLKLTYYIYYLLEKLNIVEIKIEHQENVATIFEVVNDRGLGLKPYEILKGKLIGNLNEKNKEKANEIWVNIQNKYYNTNIWYGTETKIDLDVFFKTYLRAKFADSETEYEKFEDKYHYEIYQNERILSHFKRFEDETHLYNWVTQDFKYFADTYLYIRTTYKHEYLIFNKLHDQNQQYLLILSAIKTNDHEKEAKLNLVAKKFDQMHITLRLLSIYNNNEFQNLIHKLNFQIREKSLGEIEKSFDSVTIEYLEKSKVIEEGKYKSIKDLYKWELFNNLNNDSTNISKYVLMRIDRYLSQKLDKPSYCSDSLKNIEERFNKNNRKRYGMHLEHIYAYNDKNKAIFTKDGIFDEAQFNVIRNKLGMVLLLKDSQNISSNNDYYNLKIEDYKKSDIIWNELLVGHIADVDIKKWNVPVSITTINPNEEGVFPLDKLNTRQREIFEIIMLIWAF